MTAERRDLPEIPDAARGLPIGRIRSFRIRGRAVGRTRAAEAQLAAEIEEVVATHLSIERGCVTGTERRAARLAAEIALRSVR